MRRTNQCDATQNAMERARQRSMGGFFVFRFFCRFDSFGKKFVRGIEKGRQAQEAGEANEVDELWAYLWARARHSLKWGEAQRSTNGVVVDDFVAVVEFVSFRQDRILSGNYFDRPVNL